jgi:transcription antitermination factor NusG
MTERWYVARCNPGYQRTAKAVDPGYPPESIIERNLRNEGFDAFMPTVNYEMRHHRTKKWIERRYPLLTGYLFINMDGRTFEDARRVDGIMCFLRNGTQAGPHQISHVEIRKLKDVEEENRAILEQNRKERALRNRVKTRKDMGEMMPPETVAEICGRSPFNGLLARVISPSSHGRVKAIIETLNGLVEIQVPIDDLRMVG